MKKALIAGLESEKLLIPYGVSSFFCVKICENAR